MELPRGISDPPTSRRSQDSTIPAVCGHKACNMVSGSQGDRVRVSLAKDWCRGSKLFQGDWLLRIFNKLLKTRIATKRIPKRPQFQLAICEAARSGKRKAKLLAREIFLADPRRDHR